MSYDIYLCDPITHEAIEVETPHLMHGGTYAIGGTTKRKLHQLEPLKPSNRETRVRCVETGMEFETVKQAGSALAALGLGKDAAVAAAAISNSMRTGGTAYGFHFVKVAS